MSIVWIYPILFIYSSVDRHLGCFHLLATVNSVAMTMGVQISVDVLAFTSLGYMLRSRIAGLCANSV